MTQPRYIEARSVPAGAHNQLAMDIARHLYKRQHLGTAVVISDKPLTLMCVVRKQWMRLTRSMQKERASTINAERILRLTYSVTHMQHMTFVAKIPAVEPRADVFFISPDEITGLPPNCHSLYVAAECHTPQLRGQVQQLATDALVIDYLGDIPAHEFGLLAKSGLNRRVQNSWNRVLEFLDKYQIDIEKLGSSSFQQAAVLDDALDTLLGCSIDFLRVASDFQYALGLAQPLELAQDVRRQYDLLALLAHRVQSLSNGEVNQYLQTLASDNNLFLRDSSAEEDEVMDMLGDIISRHEEAGRMQLVHALRVSN